MCCVFVILFVHSHRFSGLFYSVILMGLKYKAHWNEAGKLTLVQLMISINHLTLSLSADISETVQEITEVFVSEPNIWDCFHSLHLLSMCPGETTETFESDQICVFLSHRNGEIWTLVTDEVYCETEYKYDMIFCKRVSHVLIFRVWAWAACLIKFWMWVLVTFTALEWNP